MSRTELALGQTVIAKHKNLRYYSSRVASVTAQTFYEVMFDDGSFSNDTFPEDIVVSVCVGGEVLCSMGASNTPPYSHRAETVVSSGLRRSARSCRSSGLMGFFMVLNTWALTLHTCTRYTHTHTLSNNYIISSSSSKDTVMENESTPSDQSGARNWRTSNDSVLQSKTAMLWWWL